MCAGTEKISKRKTPNQPMKLNQWTFALAAAGIVTIPSALRADETPAPSSILTSLASTTLSGYVDTSAQWNLATGNAGTPTYSFGGSGKADGFNLNVVKIAIEKPVEAADQWSAGYKVDLIFGPDANTLATASANGGATTAFPNRDFAVKQAYVLLHAPVGNGLDFKLGVWDTLLGYEVFESINNPNFTRSYGYTIEPTTHTGLQMAYTFSDCLSAAIGVANTFGPTINGRAHPTGTGSPADGPKAESYKAYTASVTLTAPKSMGFLAGSTLSGAVINGYNAAAGADQTSAYVGTTLNLPVSGLKVGASYDY